MGHALSSAERLGGHNDGSLKSRKPEPVPPELSSIADAACATGVGVGVAPMASASHQWRPELLEAHETATGSAGLGQVLQERGLVAQATLDGGCATVLTSLSNEFVGSLLAVDFASTAAAAGFPFRQGKEAAEKGQVRMIVDMSAMPLTLVQKFAPAMASFLREWHGKVPSQDLAVQVMCSVQAAPCLELHADPGQRRCASPGQRSEVLLTLPCSNGAQSFVMGTTADLPTGQHLFTDKTGHANKAQLKGLCNVVEIKRGDNLVHIPPPHAHTPRPHTHIHTHTPPPPHTHTHTHFTPHTHTTM